MAATDEPKTGELKDLDDLTADEPDQIDAEEFIVDVKTIEPEPA
jgi:hypothetical protein